LWAASRGICLWPRSVEPEVSARCARPTALRQIAVLPVPRCKQAPQLGMPHPAPIPAAIWPTLWPVPWHSATRPLLATPTQRTTTMTTG
ncbi:hypothetical protein EC988_003815, partial [Linderina pennispora]